MVSRHKSMLDVGIWFEGWRWGRSEVRLGRSVVTSGALDVLQLYELFVQPDCVFVNMNHQT
jgi:hypothetical protein